MLSGNRGKEQKTRMCPKANYTIKELQNVKKKYDVAASTVRMGVMTIERRVTY